jgi:hypothetical protein
MSCIKVNYVMLIFECIIFVPFEVFVNHYNGMEYRRFGNMVTHAL